MYATQLRAILPFDLPNLTLDCICNRKKELLTNLTWTFCYFLAGTYLKYFTTPYFVFVRDTLSFLVHLGLHFAICLAPSSISFTRLEWAVWVFYMGRILMESKQLSGIKVLQQRKKTEIQREKNLDGSVEVISEPPKSSVPIKQTAPLSKKFEKYLR